MPRQDYSLPSIAPLPVLSSTNPDASAVDADLVIIRAHNPDSANDAEVDQDYDMLDDAEPLITRPLPTLGILPSTAPPHAVQTAESPFVDMLLGSADTPQVDHNLTTTDNGATTLVSTEDPRLDFFFEVLKGTDMATIQNLARASWSAHPLDTLRLIFQLRSVLHGKGERKEFYACLDFLRKEHPQTLLFNLRFIPDHGYWKDLLNWLVFECREDPLDFSLSSPPRKTRQEKEECPQGEEEQQSWGQAGKRKRPAGTSPESYRAMAILRAQARDQQASDQARKARLEDHDSKLGRARACFRENVFYRELHLEVARLFAEALVRDKKRLDKGQPVSLAAKWCPSLNQFHDRHTLIATTIAQILFPVSIPTDREDRPTYVARVRQLYRQQYYVPLRKAIPVLETLMAAQKWDEIIYKRVPSIAMKANKGHFAEHDKERFEEYLDSLAKGETTIAAQALMPHQLVEEAMQLQGVDPQDPRVRTLEAQWASYAERLSKAGTMGSTMAMCDVSGSMSGTPMVVAMALSLLLCRLTKAPFNQLILSFSADPVIHRVQEGSLVDQVRDLGCMDWGYNTDLAKAFDHILELAITHKLPKEDMVKTLFVFSDMEFDQAVSGGQRQDEMFTNYNVSKRKFESAGYELPGIVFWNLAGSSRGNKPAKASQKGVAMVSGFSGMLMKLFLDGTDLSQAMDPVRLMEKAIHSKEFSQLEVRD